MAWILAQNGCPSKLFVYVEVEPSDVTFFETNTNMYAVKLFVHIEWSWTHMILMYQLLEFYFFLIATNRWPYLIENNVWNYSDWSSSKHDILYYWCISHWQISCLSFIAFSSPLWILTVDWSVSIVCLSHDQKLHGLVHVSASFVVLCKWYPVSCSFSFEYIYRCFSLFEGQLYNAYYYNVCN
jgi:hypothetical protein